MTASAGSEATSLEAPLREPARSRYATRLREAARSLALPAAGGFVMALCAPPTDLYPAVVIGLALLAASVPGARTHWRAFGRGAVWGTVAGVVGLRFVPSVIQRFTPLGAFAAYLSLVLLAAAQSLIWAACAGVAHVLHKRARAPLELAFGAGVMVAVSVPTVFLWTPAGLTSPWTPLVQLAEVIGERGVSVIYGVMAALLARAGMAAHRAVIEARAGVEPATGVGRASVGAALVATARRREVLWPLAAAAAIPVVLWIEGSMRMSSIEAASAELPTVRIALVDQAVGPHERWQKNSRAPILKKLRELTHRAEAQKVALTIWPEAAYPYAIDHDATRIPTGETSPVGRGVRGPLLIGLITEDAPTEVEPGLMERNKHNSATLVAPSGGVQPPADKLQLLWFGEMVPGGQQLPWLRRIFQKSGGLIPGTEPRALELARPDGPTLRMGVLNCYEDTLPSIGRMLTRSLQPNLLVNITNDAWFHDTAESELHARLATMRAIEMRRDLVRAVNMGVITWVDASGRVRARKVSDGPDFVVVTPALRDGPRTAYASAGDAPMALLLAVASLVYGLREWRARRAAAVTPSPPAPEHAKDAKASPDAPGKEI